MKKKIDITWDWYFGIGLGFKKEGKTIFILLPFIVLEIERVK